MTKNPVNIEQARHWLAGCKPCGICSGRGHVAVRGMRADCGQCGGTGWIGKPWGRSRLSAIKKEMERVSSKKIGRLLFLDDVLEFLKTNQSFKESDVYKRKPKSTALQTAS